LVNTWANGPVIQGVSSNVFFGQNFVSTWPAAGFYMAEPATTNNSTFRILWPIADNTYYDTQYCERYRAPSQKVSLWANKLSSTAFDFTGAHVLGTYTNVTPFSESSAPDHTAPRLALTSLPAGFNPAGRVERLLRLWTAATNLAGVREIAIGQTYLTNSNSQLAVTLRAVEHRTTAGGTAGTVPLASQALWLSAELIAPGGATNQLGMLSGPTDTNGLRVLALSLGTNTTGLCRLRAWIPGGTTNFAPQTLAWASLNYSLGTVVSLSAIPDVADDKNINAAKRAQLRVSRTGTPAALAATLNAYVRIPTNGIHELTSPVDRRNLIVTYGTAPTNDYSFGTPTGGTLGTVSPGGVTQVTFDANSTSVVIPILPKADNFTEANAIRVDLVATHTYALGASTRADIYIYDGPLWTVYLLEGTNGVATYQSSGVAVNAGVITPGGGWTVPPQAVGLATWANLYGQPEQHGAVWTPQSTAPATDLGLTFQPYGISFRPTTLAADRARIVGAWGNSAYQVLDNNSGGVTLPHFPGSSGPSLAWAISPNAARTVVYSTHPITGKRRPALWVGAANPGDLSALLEDPPNERIGEAVAVNNAGVIVGYSSGFGFGGFSIKRPFRNTGGGAALTDSDYLEVPEGGTGQGTANAVVTISSKHYTVGWYRRNTASQKIGVHWTPASGQSLPSIPNDLSRLERYGTPDLQSEARGINVSRVIVGWSGSSEAGSDRRAVFYDDGRWKDLNDKHFVHGAIGWVLQSAESISDNNTIAGIGVMSGSTRGFILVPRIAGF